jgi:hypothetical protein
VKQVFKSQNKHGDKHGCVIGAEWLAGVRGLGGSRGRAAGGGYAMGRLEVEAVVRCIDPWRSPGATGMT